MEGAAPKCWSKFTTKMVRELPWHKIVIVQITNILLLSKYRLTNLFYYLNVSSVTRKVTLVFGMVSCLISSIYLGSTYCSIWNRQKNTSLCQPTTPDQLLHIKEANGSSFALTFADAVTRYGDYLNEDFLINAYRKVGSAFKGQLEQLMLDWQSLLNAAI